jgi:hypothetical protein
MDIIEAHEIFGKYADAVAATPRGDVVRKRSLLPASAAQIKEAFFIVIDASIKDMGKLPIPSELSGVFCVNRRTKRTTATSQPNHLKCSIYATPRLIYSVLFLWVFL